MTKKILLVEDDPAIIDIYQMMIKKAGFAVEVMSLGQEVLTRTKAIRGGEESKPDIVLLDLTLPDIDGTEVLKDIRSSDATKNIKVFILTNQEKIAAEKLGDAKPDKFIIKANITPTQLIDLIKEELV